MRRLAAALGLALAVGAGCAVPPLPVPRADPPPSSPGPGAPLAIDAARAKAHVDALADPSLGGRFTASAGYERAARYMADQLAAAGVEPYGDGGTFFQRFRMPLIDLAGTPTLERLGPEPRRLVHRTDFTEAVGGPGGGGTAEGRLVFLGAGARTPEVDDFSPVEVRGAVVMLVSPRSGAVAEAIDRGASGVLIVSERIIKYSYVPRLDTRTLPTLIVTAEAADALLAGSGRTIADLRRSLDARPSPTGPPPRSVAFEAPAPVRLALPLTPPREVEATNVVGIIRGADPALARRAVLLGGHLDGVGTDPDGTVFPAANDNASGPALTIELARALVARRTELRHSVIVVAFAGEEQGLWGSEHYATQVSAIPGRPESLVGYLNLDVVGCCGETLGASEESPRLFTLARRAAAAEGLSITATRGTSDQASFSRRRVEAMQLLWSDVGPIHTTRDTVAQVTAERLGRLGRVAGRIVLELARGS